MAKAKLLLLHIESSQASLPGTLIAVAGSVIAFMSTPEASIWVGRPQNTALYLTVFAFAVGGCLSTLAGYVAGSEFGSDELAIFRRSARRLSVTAVYRTVGDLVWLWSGLVVASLAAYLQTALNGTPPSASIWPLTVLSFASIAATYAVGQVAGALLRNRVWLLILAPLPYAATFISSSYISLSGQPGWQYVVAPFIDQSWHPSLVANPAPILVLVAYVAGVSACGLLVSTTVTALRQRREVPSRRGLVTAGALTSLAALTVAWSWSPNGFAQPNQSGIECGGPSEAVCVWGDQARFLTRWEEAWLASATAVEGLDVGAKRFAQYGIASVGSATTEEIQLFHPAPGVDQIRNEMLAAYAIEVLSDCETSAGYGKAYEVVTSALHERVHDAMTSPELVATVESALAEYCE